MSRTNSSVAPLGLSNDFLPYTLFIVIDKTALSILAARVALSGEGVLTGAMCTYIGYRARRTIRFDTVPFWSVVRFVWLGRRSSQAITIRPFRSPTLRDLFYLRVRVFIIIKAFPPPI